MQQFLIIQLWDLMGVVVSHLFSYGWMVKGEEMMCIFLTFLLSIDSVVCAFVRETVALFR